MTNREAQIFQWISENPMISQEELAAKAGTRDLLWLCIFPI